jgi:O-antigen ligase
MFLIKRVQGITQETYWKIFFWALVVLIPFDSILFLDRFTSKYIKFGLIFILFVGSIDIIIKNNVKLNKSLVITLLPLFLLLLINTVFSLNPFYTLIANGAIALTITLGFSSFNIIKKKDIETILKIMFLISGFVSIWAIMQFLTGFQSFFISDEIQERWREFGITSGAQLDEEYKRVFGTFFSPNTLGVYLNTIIIMLVAFLLNNKFSEKISRRLVIFILILNCVALYLTFSRTSWFSLVIGIFLLVFIKYRKLLLYVIISSIIVLVVALTVVPLDYWTTKLRLEKGLGLREDLWIAGWNIFLDYPVFGAGHGMFKNLYNHYVNISSAHPFEHPHNMLLFILSDFGLVGVVLISLFIILFLRKIWFVYQTSLRTNNYLGSAISFGLLGTLIVNLGSGLANKGTIIGWSSATFLYWILFAITYKLGSEYSHDK